MDRKSNSKAAIRSAKKSRRKKNIRFGAYILSVLLSAILILDTTGFAYADEMKPPKISRWPVSLSENTEETVSENTLKVKAIGKNDPQGTPLTELVLTDLDEPEAEKPYDKTATVTSHEKISWDVPVYWIDPNGRTADQPQAGQECLPLIVFYVPDEYVSDGLLELTPYLSDVFRKAGGVLSVADHELGVTYITAYVKDSDDPEPSVSKNKSAGETDGRTGDLAEDTEPKDSFGTDGSETPENAPSSDEPEQSDQSGTADDGDAASGRPGSKDAAPATSADEDAAPDTQAAENTAPGEPAAEDAVPVVPADENTATGEPAAEDAVPDVPTDEDAGSDPYEDLAVPSAGDSAQDGEAA